VKVVLQVWQYFEVGMGGSTPRRSPEEPPVADLRALAFEILSSNLSFSKREFLR
jgi:hypothetical protein